MMEGSDFSQAAGLLREATASGVCPGAVFGVLHAGEVVSMHATGRFTYEPDAPPVATETLFDLASVSKVVATTAMTMLLWQRGRLMLDTPLATVLSAFAKGVDAERRQRVTLRMLLTHSSGLPAWSPMYLACRSTAEVIEAAQGLELEAEPGSRMAYSDPGFILLGTALEEIAGEALDIFCMREIFAPLGMQSTLYNPAPELRASIPPTEIDRDYRGRIVQGEVHDENCWRLGGVSGHAGLFAPVRDVLRFAAAMLGPLHNRGPHLFEADTIRLFTARAGLPAGSSRALGWDTPSGAPSSSGSCFSPGSFGHLGFTGTSLWIDPLQDRAVVLLTNRTFPTRENKKIQELRPRFHDAVMHEVTATAVPQFQKGTSGAAPCI